MPTAFHMSLSRDSLKVGPCLSPGYICHICQWLELHLSVRPTKFGRNQQVVGASGSAPLPGIIPLLR